MKVNKLTFYVASGTLLLMQSCAKQGLGVTTRINGHSNVQSVIFTNITVPSDKDYTFQIAAITQAIVNSGSVEVYYKSGQTQDNWISLPQYYFFDDGGVGWMAVSSIQSGQATLFYHRVTAEPLTYRFDVIPAN